MTSLIFRTILSSRARRDSGGLEQDTIRCHCAKEDGALTNLTNHSSSFDVETSKMEVTVLLQWHHTNTARSSQLIFDKKYQRDKNVGLESWDAEKKS